MNKILLKIIIILLLIITGCSKEKKIEEESSLLYEKGKEAYENKKYDEAIDVLSTAVKINTDSITDEPLYTKSKEVIIKSKEIIGDCFLKTSKPKDAISIYSDLIHLEISNSSHFLKSGIAKSMIGKYEDAFKDFDDGIIVEPDNSELFRERAIINNILGNSEEAFADVEKAFYFDKDSINGFYSRGFIYYDNSEDDKALKDFLRYLEKRPNDEQINFHVGKIYNLKKNYGKAINYLTKSIDNGFIKVSAFHERGNAFAQIGYYQNAIDDLTLAIKLDSNIANLYVSRGNLYYAKSKYDRKAVEDWEKALKLDPNKTELLLKIEKVYINIENAGKMLIRELQR